MKTFFKIVLAISIIMIVGNLIMLATSAEIFCYDTLKILWKISLAGFGVGAIGSIIMLCREKEVQ